MDCHSILFLFLFLIELVYSSDLLTFPSFCQGIGNYSTNSSYLKYLESALSSLETKVGDSGFVYDSVRRVNATALCRADYETEECRNCISRAISEISQSQYCSSYTQANLWWEGDCTIRYSNESILGIMVDRGGLHGWNLNAPSSDIVITFRSDLLQLLQDLQGNASAGGPVVKVAAGNISANVMTIYAMEQCSPDISSDDCYTCLGVAVNKIPPAADLKIGYRILFPSCMLRYEIYQFFNSTRIQEVGALYSSQPRSLPPLISPSHSHSLPPPSPQPAGSKKNGSKQNITIVVVVLLLSWLWHPQV